MAKAFAKGQNVTYIASWDDRGTYYFRHAVVYSCGTKQMVLTDAATGTEMGRHFTPEMGNPEDTRGGTFPRMTDEDAIKLCLTLAEARNANQREHYAERRAFAEAKKFDGYEGYIRAMHKNEALLHDPRASVYSILHEEAVAKMAARLAK